MTSTIFPSTFYSNEALEKRENDKGRSVMTRSNDMKATTKEKNGIKAPQAEEQRKKDRRK